MNQPWRIRRTLVPVPEASRHWDQAYQALLRWSRPCLVDPFPRRGHDRPYLPEVSDVYRPVRAGLDRSPSPRPNH